MLPLIKKFLYGTEIVIAHKYQKPPWGGGNQFLTALLKYWRNQEMSVGANTFGKDNKWILVNSHTFSPKIERKILKSSAEIVHRIDGPTSVYGRNDASLDKKIYEWNNSNASKTIFQSKYSLDKHLELGFKFKNTTVIHNAVDPEIFYLPKMKKARGKKIRIIAASWSDNPKKGKAAFEWLDKNLDFNRFEFRFVGRVNSTFSNIQTHPPVSSVQMGEFLRESDVYLFASQFDSCSNSLIEALSCGLPAVYHNSGGNPELVKGGGIAFESPEEIIPALDKLNENLESYREKINVMSISEVAEKYLSFFKDQSDD